jgi:hypothetical protein
MQIILIKDVDNFIELLTKIYDESEFTFYNPGEYAPTTSEVISIDLTIGTPEESIVFKLSVILDKYNFLYKFKI